jgi:hypothetical protein
MKIKTIIQSANGVLGGKMIFVGIVGLFALSAIIIATTASFPLPFDESYHFSLIQYYSQHVSPFISQQPSELAVVGDSTRLTSYLMHYILGFPLRAIGVFSNDIGLQVVALRMFNIAFVVAALVLFRRFISNITKSGVISNAAVALYCALPVTTLLAAHINYDNLLLLCMAGLLVSGQSLLSNREARLSRVLIFMSIALAGSLVKVTFIPIALVALLFVVVVLIRRKAWRSLFRANTANKYVLAGAVVLFVASAGLFVERVGGNLVSYGTPQPDCSDVQPLNVCSQYGPWARNYALEQASATDLSFEGRSIQDYFANIWVPLTIRGLGGVDSNGIVPVIPKAVLISIIGITAGLVSGLFLFLLRRKDLPLLMLVLGVSLYMIALLQRNYSEFMELHEVIGVQGRYIVPFIVPFVAAGILGIAMAARRSARHLRRAFAQLKMLLDLDPDEAYERSLSYWSTIVWRRGSAEG